MNSYSYTGLCLLLSISLLQPLHHHATLKNCMCDFWRMSQTAGRKAALQQDERTNLSSPCKDCCYRSRKCLAHGISEFPDGLNLPYFSFI